MKKILIASLNIIFIIAIMSISACNTSKRGIVPCPSYGKSIIIKPSITEQIIKPV